MDIKGDQIGNLITKVVKQRKTVPHKIMSLHETQVVNNVNRIRNANVELRNDVMNISIALKSNDIQSLIKQMGPKEEFSGIKRLRQQQKNELEIQQYMDLVNSFNSTDQMEE